MGMCGYVFFTLESNLPWIIGRKSPAPALSLIIDNAPNVKTKNTRLRNISKIKPIPMLSLKRHSLLAFNLWLCESPNTY